MLFFLIQPTVLWTENAIFLISALGLIDSPIGLAGYILEKFSSGTGLNNRQLRDGGLTKVFTLDDLLTNIAIYWFTGTIGSSMRLYKELFQDETLFKLDRWVWFSHYVPQKLWKQFCFPLFCYWFNHYVYRRWRGGVLLGRALLIRTLR